ncbi:5-formyltetrahydrofolate cyclo-ligase [Corynebacterium yudongzhengii]|uniref:5-formyltetrahydrofolate cyclo-ligase n=1 Tax=Corynebacterium yudongzhengii TaxID=2080740 RepID=A0A2U1T7V5_9CORY|nr:5-formyltetrahydrofolate cyclo-ligase [Corynebacterium yudongzhengii]AWB82302.1 5-formyltetrahydrofolate cyclo-ligase [Corynebacterium yudongzhengii]PWC02079.1 5-formyltetrahydrofolate cyclo-ligase [Corynebacterium yudongzhengii]
MSANADKNAKTQLRRQLADARRALNTADIDRQSAAVISFAVALVRAQPAHPVRVATYHPQATEPGGRLLVETLRSEVHTLYLPVTRPQGRLEWGRYQDPERTRTGSLGIVEPLEPYRDTSALLECSVVFVPALAVSERGVRLGRGGGYYDRTLQELRSLAGDGRTPLTVALQFSGEITDKVIAEDHDEHVDMAITPEGITDFR